MVLWGADVSHYQGSFDMQRARAEGFEFVFIKATEGDGFVDSRFAANLANARAAGLLVAAYHYQREDASPAAQADNVASVVPRDVPVILDVEAGSGGTGHAAATMRELHARGYTTPLLYLPAWYWRQIGEPDLSGFPPLWKSRYPDNEGGYASEIYQRVPGHYWDGYGGNEVAVLQFTSSATIAGQAPVDGNAYRDTREDLAALIGGTTTIEEDDMPSAQEIAEAVWNHRTGVWPNTEAMEDEMATWRQQHQARGFAHMTHDKVVRLEGQVAGLTGKVAGLTDLAQQLADGQTVDYERIDRVVRDAVAESTVNVDVSIDGQKPHE